LNFFIENIDKSFALIEITIGKDGKVLDAISPWDKCWFNQIKNIFFKKIRQYCIH